MTSKGQPEPSSARIQSAIGHHEQPRTADWGWALAQAPLDLAALVRAKKAHLWLERFVRALDRRLVGAFDLPSSERDSAEPQWLPPHVIPIVGARSDQVGALGAMKIGRSEQTLSASGSDVIVKPVGDDLESAAQAGVSLVCKAVTELVPDAYRPVIELEVEHIAAGDSVALPAAIGALLNIFGLTWPADMVASGGIDVQRGIFRPVPSETLASKAKAARAWGFTRILLVEDMDDDNDLDEIEGLRVERVPGHPAALAIALAQLQGIDLDEENIAKALTVFDLRVGRAGAHMLGEVIRATAPFIEGTSPLVRHIAFDMRSRALLHVGRTSEAQQALHEADALRGQGDLPDGRLRDVLRYQQPAHRSIIHLDLGEWSDEHPAHRAVDELIAELDSEWPTKHERLMRFFLANTRARRHEYLGRLHGDESRFESAWTDLLHDSKQWSDLLDQFAQQELHLPDTNRERIHNQITDLAWSRVVCSGVLPTSWQVVLESWEAPRVPLVESLNEAVIEYTLTSGETLHIGKSGFDALARLKRHIALGEPGLPPELEELQNAITCRVIGAPSYPWFYWLELGATLAREHGMDLPLPEHGKEGGFEQAWSFLLNAPMGIAQIIALRSDQLLRGLNRSLPSVQPPDPETPLGRLFNELQSDPSSVIRRAPY